MSVLFLFEINTFLYSDFRIMKSFLRLHIATIPLLKTMYR